MRCDCEDWKENIDKIDGLLVLAAVHNSPYTGKRFVHCPWCGQMLKKSEEDWEVEGEKKVSKESIRLSRIKPAPIRVMPRIIILLGPNLSTKKPPNGPRSPSSILDIAKAPDMATRDQPNSWIRGIKKVLKP